MRTVPATRQRSLTTRLPHPTPCHICRPICSRQLTAASTPTSRTAPLAASLCSTAPPARPPRRTPAGLPPAPAARPAASRSCSAAASWSASFSARSATPASPSLPRCSCRDGTGRGSRYVVSCSVLSVLSQSHSCAWRQNTSATTNTEPASRDTRLTTTGSTHVPLSVSCQRWHVIVQPLLVLR